MERLSLCSKVLYDVDILKKQKEIIKLQKDLKGPSVFFNSWKEWEETQEKIYTNIHGVLNEYIVKDEFEYHYMECFGITSRQTSAFYDIINSELYGLTKDGEWSRKITEHIDHSLNAFLDGFMELNLWKTIIYDRLSKQQLSDLLFYTIRYQLETNFFKDIAEFKCNTCKKIVDYCEEDICYDCSHQVQSPPALYSTKVIGNVMISTRIDK